MKLSGITTTILDMPLAHPISMSFGHVKDQAIVLVRAICSEGVVGYGEAGLLGGPYWGVESAESVKATIDRYIAPGVIAKQFDGLEAISTALRALIRGNAAARGSVEMALLDILGRRIGVPASTLLGGVVRDEIPVAWTLSTGSTAQDIEEGQRAIDERGHRQFKLKIGRGDPEQEVERVGAICLAFDGRARVTADINQGWDEPTASRWLPVLADAGLYAIEQPLPAWNLEGMARVQASLGIPVIADEAITGLHEAQAIIQTRAAQAIALKPNRDGGIWVTRKIASLAEANGIALYGGTMLESSLGTAALAMLYSTIPQMSLGTELFGPQRLRDDIVGESATVRDGLLKVPAGPGMGVDLDLEKVRFYTRES